MQPQERDLLTALIDRLRQAPPQQKDAEAEQMIRDAVRNTPDAPYLLAQTVLMQDFALNQAQQRIQELERRVAAPQPQQQGGGSFLGNIFGGAPQRPQPQVPPQPQPGYAQSPYGQQPQPAAGPWGSAPPAAAPGFAGGSGPSFLRSAAATAAGVAGGALLFQGISSLFGGNHAFAQGVASPGLNETIINNYYGSDAGSAAGGDHDTPPSDDQDVGMTDASYDQSDYGSDFDSGDDYV